jgi:cytidylate kinase
VQHLDLGQVAKIVISGSMSKILYIVQMSTGEFFRAFSWCFVKPDDAWAHSSATRSINWPNLSDTLAAEWGIFLKRFSVSESNIRNNAVGCMVLSVLALSKYRAVLEIGKIRESGMMSAKGKTHNCRMFPVHDADEGLDQFLVAERWKSIA